jgi:hypothetical protein
MNHWPAPRPRLAEGFPELNPARPMLGFRPRSGSQTGFLTDDNLPQLICTNPWCAQERAAQSPSIEALDASLQAG